jgi:hypothetical protein
MQLYEFAKPILLLYKIIITNKSIRVLLALLHLIGKLTINNQLAIKPTQWAWVL